MAATAAAKIETISEIAYSYLFKDILAFDCVRGSLSLAGRFAQAAGVSDRQRGVAERGAGNATGYGRQDRRALPGPAGEIVRHLPARRLQSQPAQRGHQQAKYYFFDVGIRNALIAQFNPLNQRNDVGQLWENFVVVERMRCWCGIYANVYFWRTYDGEEVDLVEEREGRLFGYECKWSATRRVAAPRSWLGTYPEAEFTVITPDSYLDLIL